MKRLARLAAAALAVALPGLAWADQASFVAASDICIGNAMTFPGARQDFARTGWPEQPGMSPVEYEYARGDTSVFLSLAAPAEQPGCTIMDATVSVDFAYKVLVTTLGAHFPGGQRIDDFNGGDVWLVSSDLGTLVFSVYEDMSGQGGAISVELRQDI